METSVLSCCRYYDFPSIFLLLLVLMQGVRGWPEGTYGIPMAESGCPQADNFEWLTGSRTQKTRPGSYGINSSHLAGIQATKTDPADRVVQNFCIKTSYIADGDYEWEKGQYCIYKKDRCPDHFEEGEIYWDDNVPLIFGDDNVQDKSGALPDGDYGKNTRIHFCCRRDGHAGKPIHLPTMSAFYLLELGSECQRVEGMSAEEEWVYWAGETSLNLDDQKGSYPRLTRSKFPTKFTRLYYCYYTPVKATSSLHTALTVVYVLAGIVAFIVLFFVVLCVIQRCCSSSKYQESPHNAEHMGPQVQFTASTEQSLIFRSPRQTPNTSNGGRNGETTAFLSNKTCITENPRYSIELANGKVGGGGDIIDRQVLRPSAPPSCSSTEGLERGDSLNLERQIAVVNTGKATEQDMPALVPSAPPIIETGPAPIVSPPSYDEVFSKVV